MQAVDLRIQIEESVKQRPLTAIEKQEIVNLQVSRPGSIHGGRIDHKRLGTAAAGTRGPDMAAMGGGRINGLP